MQTQATLLSSWDHRAARSCALLEARAQPHSQRKAQVGPGSLHLGYFHVLESSISGTQLKAREVVLHTGCTWKSPGEL